MFQLFRYLSFRYVIQRWDRALLVIASIALGVATLVSTLIINECLDSIANNTTNPVAMGDLHVFNGELGVPEAVITDLRKEPIPGLKSILPLVYDRVVINDMDSQAAILLGTDFSAIIKDLAKTKSDSSAVKAPENLESQLGVSIEMMPNFLIKYALGRPVWISRDLYERRLAQGLDASKPLEIRVSTKPIKFDIIGIITFDPNSPAISFSKSLIAMEYNQAAKTLHADPPPVLVMIGGGAFLAQREVEPSRVSRIDLFLEEGANPEQVLQSVQKLVGNRGKVRTPEEQRKATEDVIGGVQISFSLCAVGAIVVGLFLVYNAISVSVTERRHDIGILRSLGANRYQIARLFTFEAIFLGLLGGILGIPFGVFLSKFALSQIQEEIDSLFSAANFASTQITWWIAASALLSGMATALLASLFPAIQAASDEPADAVRRAPSAVAGLYRLLHLGSSFLLIFGGVGLVLLRDYLPPRVGSYTGLVTTLVGMFLALPLFVGILARIIQPILRPIFGIEARLAADNLIRAPGRTGIVIGALAGGVSLMFQTSGIGRSNEEPVVDWIDQVVRGDAIVLWGNLLTASSSSSPILSYIADEIVQEMPDEVESVVRFRIHRPEYADTIIYLQAIDALNFKKAIENRVADPPPGLKYFDQLPLGNNCVVSENFAIRYHKKIGDTIKIPGPNGAIELLIVGIGRDYSWNKGTIFLDRKIYLELFQDDYSDFFHVYFKQGVDKQMAMKKLERLMDSHQLMVKDRKFVIDFLMSEIAKIYKLAYTQQFLVGVVASLGVVMSLLISVLQRRRELGLLRAVGASRGQVLTSVLAEALLMGVLGTILGIAMGIPIEWFLLRIVLFEESGFYFDVLIPWWQTLVIAMIAISTAILAGLIPAIHAVRLKITDAIAYE